jgi:ATP-binding cassette subfamily B protein
MVCTFPVLVLAAILIGRLIRRRSREAQDHLAAAAVVLDESLQGIASVKAFGAEAFETSRYHGHLSQYLERIVGASRMRACLVSFIIFGVFGSVVGVFWYGAHLLQGGALSFGELTRFILYTTFVGGSVASFADLFGQVQRTAGATQRLRELLGESPEPASARAQSLLGGSVAFDNVAFAYPSRPDHPILRGMSFHVPEGCKVALVGPSGAGKSTIVSLLLRFYEPSSGRVLIGGLPAASVPLARVRRSMAVVPQDVLLFGGTIEENIRYGNPSASSSELLAASQRALCHGFIETFPQGYATLVGDRGIKLSGGQRQRIAIARALLADPPILILDEATSSLDAESERLIQQALAALLEGRTAIIIAHRLATVRSADRIFFIEDGRVSEQGTHDELVALNGQYRHLASLQFDLDETPGNPGLQTAPDPPR